MHCSQRTKGFCLLLLLMLPLVLRAQTEDLRKRYPILQTEKNHLQYPGDSTPFYAFYQKLDTLLFAGKGQVNVVHIGGSHVQGGSLSHAMREHMLSISPYMQSARGFFFPYTLAKTNNPGDYSVRYTGRWEGCRCSVNSHHCRWGASGVVAHTESAHAQVRIYARDGGDSLYPFDGVRIFYQMTPESYAVALDSSLLQITDTLLYDSARQFVEYRFRESADTLSFGLAAKDSLSREFSIRGIQYLHDSPGLVYHTIGVNGASTESYLRCEDFATELEAIVPDLVIFGIGINDAYVPQSYFSQRRFEDNYETLMGWFRQANPDVAFLFLTNNDSFYRRRYANPNSLKVSDGMYALAKKHDAALWDLMEVMGGFNSVHVWNEYGLAKSDMLHFSREGYNLQADLLFSAIKEAYGNYLQYHYEAERP